MMFGRDPADVRGMTALLLLTSPPRTLSAVGGGSAAGPSRSRHLMRGNDSVALRRNLLQNYFGPSGEERLFKPNKQ
jgi:hypothetical protein